MESWQTEALRRAIESLEQGRFQDFCLDFLPIYDPALKGLVRLGHTAEGKTRKGHPDLYKDTPDGIIGVECSVDRKYWVLREDFTKSKPISDSLACLDRFGTRLKRLILCSSQDPGIDAAQKRSRILDYLREAHGLEAMIIACPDFEQMVDSERAKCSQIIREYWPQLHAQLYVEAGTATADYAHRLYRQSRAPYGILVQSIERVISESVGAHTSSSLDQQILADAFAASTSRFRVEPPEVGSVLRSVKWESFGGEPFGKIVSVYGLPKIGKSCLVSQLCRALRPKAENIAWFSTPARKDHYEFEQRQAVADILRSVLQHCLSPLTVNELLEGRLSADRAAENETAGPAEPQIIIIDNAENFDRVALGQLSRHLTWAFSQLCVQNIAVIFISIVPLRAIATAIQVEVECPSWSEEDLHELIKTEGLLPSEHGKAYVRLLALRGWAHPLVCLSLARRFPDPQTLVTAPLAERRAALFDEQLTAEVRTVLYDDFLKEPDRAQFVEMVSVLLFPFTAAEADHLKRRVHPENRTATLRMIRELHGAVIEGDLDGHLTTADVFGEVAREHVSSEQQRLIHEAMAQHLVTPAGKTIRAEKACDAIIYYLAAGNQLAALQWTALLLSRRLPKLSGPEAQYLCGRLLVVRHMNPPQDAQQFGLYVLVMLGFYYALWLLRKREDARRCIEDLHDRVTERAPQVEDVLRGTVEWAWHMSAVYRALEAGAKAEALGIISQIRVIEGTADLETYDAVLNLIPLLLGYSSLVDLPLAFIVDVVESTRPADEGRIALVLSCATAIGMACEREARTPESVLDEVSCEHTLWSVFQVTCIAQFKVSKGLEEEALADLETALRGLEGWAREPGLAGRHVRLLVADVHHNLGREMEAREQYLSLLEDFSPSEEAFYHGWCQFRLAATEPELTSSIRRLEHASGLFKSSGYIHDSAVALGEKSVALALSGQLTTAVEVLESILDEHFVRRNREFGTAALVAGSLLSNISLHDEPSRTTSPGLTGELIIGFERGVFARAARGAQPLAGGVAAYWFLARAYDRCGDSGRASASLRKILDFPITGPRDYGPYVLGTLDLASSFKARSIRHLEGLELLAQAPELAHTVLEYGRWLLRGWVLLSRSRPKRIHDWDIRFAWDLGDSAVAIDGMTIGDEQKSACMLLVLVLVAPSDKSPQLVRLTAEWYNLLRDRIEEIPPAVRTLISRLDPGVS